MTNPTTRNGTAQAGAASLEELIAAITCLDERVKRIETALIAIASRNAPNWKRPLSAYTNGWPQAIDAYVLSSDQHGPTAVSWMGRVFTRRSGENKKYGAAIWFSAPNGKDAEGNVNYERLITFSSTEFNAEDLPQYVEVALSKAIAQRNGSRS